MKPVFTRGATCGAAGSRVVLVVGDCGGPRNWDRQGHCRPDPSGWASGRNAASRTCCCIPWTSGLACLEELASSEHAERQQADNQNDAHEESKEVLASRDILRRV